MSWKAVALQQHQAARPQGRAMALLLKPAAIAVLAALGLGLLAASPWLVIPGSAAFATAGHVDARPEGGIGEWVIVFVAMCTLLTPIWSFGRIAAYVATGA